MILFWFFFWLTEEISNLALLRLTQELTMLSLTEEEPVLDLHTADPIDASSGSFFGLPKRYQTLLF
jgi:hypothetical protein